MIFLFLWSFDPLFLLHCTQFQEIYQAAPFEKKKDIFSLYEGEIEMYKQKTEDEEIKGYEDFEGIEEEWEDFNQRDFKK